MGLRGLIVAAAAVLVLLGATASAETRAAERTLYPVADAFVVAAPSRADTRRAAVLRISSRPARTAYVSFVQRTPLGSIESATLVLTVRRGGSGLTAAVARNPWRTGALDARRAPTPFAGTVRVRTLKAGRRVALDVTGLLRQPGLVTFVLRSTGGSSDLASAEAGKAVSPRLVIRVRGAEAPPGPQPPEPPRAPGQPPAPPTDDRSAPSTPPGLRVAARDAGSLTLAWDASTDNVGVTSYRATLAGAGSASTTQTSQRFEGLACDTAYDATVVARDAAGNESPPAPLGVRTASCPRIAAAGDIAGDGNGDEITARLVEGLGPTAVLTTGDNAYPDGAAAEYAAFYEPTWGRFKSITRPTPGNHEYHTPGAAGYFGYFGAAAGPSGRGYYSFDLGDWHLIALNSEIPAGTGSEQLAWLRSDLAATSARCVLAYWHRPRFSAGAYPDDATLAPFWQALYDAGAEVVLNGHDHNYQRYSLLDPAGNADATRGLRQFLIGTGGRSHYPLAADARRAAGTSGVFGVLELTLRRDAYAWRFVAEPGSSYTDSGSGACR